MKTRAAASERVLLFTVEKARFALPLENVERVVRAVAVTPLPGAPEAVVGVIDVHGMITPVFDVRRRLGFPESEIEPENSFVLAWSAGRLVALVVEAVGDVIELSADEVIETDAVAEHAAVIDGILKLRDGLALVQDLDEFLSAEEKQRLAQALEPRELEPLSRATPEAG